MKHTNQLKKYIQAKHRLERKLQQINREIDKSQREEYSEADEDNNDSLE